MKLIDILVLGVLAGVIGSRLYEYFNKKRVCNQLKYIHRYLKILEMNDVLIKHKGKNFFITVKSILDDPVYKKLLYINNELVLTAYELNHGTTNSRQLEYNHDRSEYEIDKLQKLIYKKLKRIYYNKYLKVDYSFKSFWED